MEKTLDEKLYEKFRERSRMHLRMQERPHMPQEGEAPERPECPEGPERPERPFEGRCHGRMEGGPEHMPGMPEMRGRGSGMGHPHRPQFLQRERILGVLLDADEKGLNQKQILEQIHIHPSSLSELIDKLEGDRYVERTVNPEDKRSTLIVLTEKGKARAYEVRDEHARRCAKMFGALTEEEKEKIYWKNASSLLRMNLKNQ